MDWLHRMTGSIRHRAWSQAPHKPIAKGVWRGWPHATRIAILFDANADRTALQAMREIVDYYKARQRHVTLCAWTDSYREKNNLYSGRQLVFLDDFNWRGEPQAGNALELVQSNFDLLFAFNRNGSTPIDDLARRTPSGLRVTIGGKQDFYDIHLAEPDHLWSELIPLFDTAGQWLQKIQHDKP